MNRISRFVFWIVVLSATIGLSVAATVENPIETNQKLFLTDLQLFSKSTQELNNVAVSYSENQTDKPTLRMAFKKARLDLKSIQMIGEYLDSEYFFWNINGPPLPRLDPNETKIDPLDPLGLQVIDELINEDTIDTEKLIYLTSRLVSATEMMARYQSRIPLEARFIFESARFEIIRILSLGITGFDTPASTQNVLNESAVALSTVKRHIEPWLAKLDGDNQSLGDSIASKLSAGISIIENSSVFISLDRAALTSEVLNPLFGMITRAQIHLNITTQYDISRIAKYSTNYLAENIFSDELLNPFFYTQITKKTYNPKLVELGTYLFFDPILSENGDRACASCHDPEKAYTDRKKKSIAKDFVGTLDRNAPTILNAVYSDKFFYDLRANSLEGQVEHVIVNEKEFHTDYPKVATRLKASPEYVKLFKQAFPTIESDPINSYTISGALAAFQISTSSFNSKFDRYARGEKVEITPDELAGYNLFMGKAACGTCHFAPTFAGLVPPLFHESESEVLGVPVDFDPNKEVLELDSDIGRYGGVIRDQAPHFKHSFKTTTVRNAELTGPYMHNGSVTTLAELMEFYNFGGGAGYGINLDHQTLSDEPLGLNQEEASQVIAFINSLTDTSRTIYAPPRLPQYNDEKINLRKIGGEY